MVPAILFNSTGHSLGKQEPPWNNVAIPWINDYVYILLK